MPLHGGLAYGRERYGGAVPRVQVILDALNEQLGSAYDVSKDSPVYIRNLAIARMLASVWDSNERLGNQFDPLRMTDFLPRWERIFGIVPSPTATEPERRRVIAARFARIGVAPTHQAIVDALAAALGDIAFTVERTDPDVATMKWPVEMGPTVASGTAPPTVTITGDPNGEQVHVELLTGGVFPSVTFQWSIDDGATWTGPVTPSGLAFAIPGTALTVNFTAGTYTTGNLYVAHSYPDEWTSNVAYIAIPCVKPVAMSEAEFYERMGVVFATLDPYVPAWLDFDWFRDGVNGAGFYLDEDPNLDNQRFD